MGRKSATGHLREVPTSQPTPHQLGLVIRALRQTRSEWSQEELAGRAKLDRTYISGLERGRHNPSFQTLSRVLAVLGVSWAEFGAALDHAVRQGNGQ